MGGYEMTNVDYTNMAGTVSQPEFVDVDTLKMLNNKDFLVAVAAVARVVKVASKFIEPIKRFQHLAVEQMMVAQGNKLEEQEAKVAELEEKVASMDTAESALDQKIASLEQSLTVNNDAVMYATIAMYKMQREQEGNIILKLKETKLRKARENRDNIKEAYLKLINKYHVTLGAVQEQKKTSRRIAQLTEIRVRAVDGVNEAIELEFENGKVISHIYTDESMLKLAKDFPQLTPEYINVQTKVVEEKPVVEAPMVEPVIENAIPEVPTPIMMNDVLNKLDALEINVVPEVQTQEIHSLPMEMEEPYPNQLPIVEPVVEPIVEPVVEVAAPVEVEAPVVEEVKEEVSVAETEEAKSAKESAQIFKDEGFTAKEKELNRLEGLTTNVDGPYNRIASNAMESARAFIENGLTSYERMLKEKELENEELKGNNQIVEKENEELKNMNASLKEENNGSKIKIETLMESNENSKAEIETLKQTNEELAKTNEALRNDIKSLTDNFKQLQNQFSAFFQQFNVESNERIKS